MPAVHQGQTEEHLRFLHLRFHQHRPYPQTANQACCLRRSGLKAAEYQLREQVNSRMRMIIIVNTLVFPLLLLFAIWSVNYVLRLRIRRQAERYIND